MNPLERKLNDLVLDSVIKEYELSDISCDGEIGVESDCRNTQRLKIVFNTGDTLIIGTYCSGCLENTGFTLEE